MPATCGVAIDVPVRATLPVPLPLFAETMLVPGAATSGLMVLTEPYVPRDDEVFRVSGAPTGAARSPTESATVSAEVALPGAPPTRVRSPAFPAATTDSTPWAASASIIAFSGSSSAA